MILTSLDVITQEPHDFNRVECQAPQSNEWINESIEIQHAVYEPKPFDADHVFTKGDIKLEF